MVSLGYVGFLTGVFLELSPLEKLTTKMDSDLTNAM